MEKSESFEKALQEIEFKNYLEIIEKDINEWQAENLFYLSNQQILSIKEAYVSAGSPTHNQLDIGLFLYNNKEFYVCIDRKQQITMPHFNLPPVRSQNEAKTIQINLHPYLTLTLFAILDLDKKEQPYPYAFVVATKLIDKIHTDGLIFSWYKSQSELPIQTKRKGVSINIHSISTPPRDAQMRQEGKMLIYEGIDKTNIREYASSILAKSGQKLFEKDMGSNTEVWAKNVIVIAKAIDEKKNSEGYFSFEPDRWSLELYGKVTRATIDTLRERFSFLANTTFHRRLITTENNQRINKDHRFVLFNPIESFEGKSRKQDGKMYYYEAKSKIYDPFLEECNKRYQLVTSDILKLAAYSNEYPLAIMLINWIAEQTREHCFVPGKAINKSLSGYGLRDLEVNETRLYSELMMDKKGSSENKKRVQRALDFLKEKEVLIQGWVYRNNNYIFVFTSPLNIDKDPYELF